MNFFRLLESLPGNDDAGSGSGHEQDTGQTIHPHAPVTGCGEVKAAGIHYAEGYKGIDALYTVDSEISPVWVMYSVFPLL